MIGNWTPFRNPALVHLLFFAIQYTTAAAGPLILLAELYSHHGWNTERRLLPAVLVSLRWLPWLECTKSADSKIGDCLAVPDIKADTDTSAALTLVNA